MKRMQHWLLRNRHKRTFPKECHAVARFAKVRSLLNLQYNILRTPAWHCNTLHTTTTHCNTQQHTAKFAIQHTIYNTNTALTFERLSRNDMSKEVTSRLRCHNDMSLSWETLKRDSQERDMSLWVRVRVSLERDMSLFSLFWVTRFRCHTGVSFRDVTKWHLRQSVIEMTSPKE